MGKDQSKTQMMPTDQRMMRVEPYRTHTLVVRLEYDFLLLNTTLEILRQIERAYEALQRAEPARMRVRAFDQLKLDSVRSGSLTLYLSGGWHLVSLVLLLPFAQKALDLRLKYHQGEKVKWEGKRERLEYENRLKELENTERGRAALEKSVQELSKLIARVGESMEIRSLQFEVDPNDEQEDQSNMLRSKRQFSLPDE